MSPTQRLAVLPSHITDAVDPTSWRARMAWFIYHPRIQRLLMALICLNAITLGLETSNTMMAVIGPELLLFDGLVLLVFVIELVMKLFIERRDFFKSGWNVFDLAIVSIALLPATGAMAILRALRVLRVLRMLSLIPSLRRVVDSLFLALPGISAVLGVIIILFYVYAVMGAKLFGAQFPHMFGTLGTSLYTMFEVMTLEGWSSSVVRPISAVYPFAWLYFIPFILIVTFAVLNLFISVIVESMQRVHAAEMPSNDDLLASIERLRSEVRDLKKSRD